MSAVPLCPVSRFAPSSPMIDQYNMWVFTLISIPKYVNKQYDTTGRPGGGGAHRKKIMIVCITKDWINTVASVTDVGNGGGAPIHPGGGGRQAKKKGLQQTKEKKHPLRHRERRASSICYFCY